jgi:hypothetical protein
MKESIIYDAGKVAIEGYYDYQDIRISQQNRIRDVIRRKIEGIPLDKPEEKKEKSFAKEFTDKELGKLLRKLSKEEKITKGESEYLEKLWSISVETKKLENRYKILMDEYLSIEPIWCEWLKDIKGISSVLGSSLIKNFGYCEIIISENTIGDDEKPKTGEMIGRETGDKKEFEKAWKLYQNNPELHHRSGYPYISSLWKHCGLDPDGAKGRKKGEILHYNPKLKTLAWKIADSFVKQRTHPYRGIYDNEKVIQQERVYPIGHLKKNFGGKYKDSDVKLTKLHVELRARRKMIKIFLQHYWLVGRTLKGLPVSMPYQFEKLGHKSFIPPPHFRLTKSPTKPETRK